jgi:hypothetical protein
LCLGRAGTPAILERFHFCGFHPFLLHSF